MKDTLQETNIGESAAQKSSESVAIELGKLLTSHKGGGAVVMDMRRLNFWTDFFVIATVTSSTHLSGLDRHIKDYVYGNGLEILRRSGKPTVDDEWILIDMGDIVIHLMTARARSFFELERLWSSASFIYEDPDTEKPNTEVLSDESASYSSKSS